LFRFPGRSFFQHREQHAPDQSVERSFVGMIFGGVGQQRIGQRRPSLRRGGANQAS
jgi:hypothetical protein